jgi:hypothetical protein
MLADLQSSVKHSSQCSPPRRRLTYEGLDLRSSNRHTTSALSRSLGCQSQYAQLSLLLFPWIWQSMIQNSGLKLPPDLEWKPTHLTSRISPQIGGKSSKSCPTLKNPAPHQNTRDLSKELPKLHNPVRPPSFSNPAIPNHFPTPKPQTSPTSSTLTLNSTSLSHHNKETSRRSPPTPSNSLLNPNCCPELHIPPITGKP